MNVKAIVLASILGLSTPAIASLSFNPPAIAQGALPIGTFEDSLWTIDLSYYNNTLSYYGTNKQTGDSLELRGATVAGTARRRLYIWNNGDYRYQVAWQPNDPNYIRLQVFNARGRIMLNRLLSRTN